MNYSIEFLRLMAVVLITFTHTRHEFSQGNFYFIIQELPKYGTLILSIISGFLFWKTTRRSKDILTKKIKSLLIPFLIANGTVLVLVLMFNFMGYNFLNRLDYDSRLLFEGLLAFNIAPINPPTYFIRDLFVVFTLLALFLRSNIKALWFIIPLIIWGKLFIRTDIVYLFIVGCLYGYSEKMISKRVGLGLIILTSIISWFYLKSFFPYLVSVFVFYLVIDIRIKFLKVGSFTYLLHLYHSPIMIATFPVINHFITNNYINVILQIVISIVIVLGLTQIIKKNPKLSFISGGR